MIPFRSGKQFSSIFERRTIVDKAIQLLVGPTALPLRVLKAMSHEAFSHRGPYYQQIQHAVTEGMKAIFQTKNDVLMLTTSGTGAMEAVIQNCFLPGDEVVIPVNGLFGELFYEVAKGYSLAIKRVEFEYGTAADIREVMKHVTPRTKGVLLIHNESSTGVVNPIQEFGQALKDTDALLIVDSVSGAGGIPIRMDDWHIDVIFTASQKALMSPPGLAFVAIGEKAWKKIEAVHNPRYFFNFLRDREYGRRNLTVHTPATHTMLAVYEALKMIGEEGLERVFERHARNARLVREGMRELGFRIFAKDDAYASPTLTTILAPGLAEYYVQELAKQNILVGAGKSSLKKNTFRVGTMGYVHKKDVRTFLMAMEDIVKQTRKSAVMA